VTVLPVKLDRAAAAAAGSVSSVLRALIDHAPVAMFVKDRAGRYLLVNREFEAIFGLDEAWLLGRSAFDVMPSEVAERLRANDAQAFASRDPVTVEETVLRDGVPRVFRSVKFSLRDGLDQPWAMCGVSIDITDERRAHEQAVEAAGELKRSNEELARFAASASHDLSEPLRVIAGFSELLARRSGATLDERSRDYLAQISASTVRMRELIDGMLSMAQLQPHTLVRERVALDELFASAVEDLSVSIRERDASVDASPLPLVWGDRVQLRVLFQNLLSNALKFTPASRTPIIEVSPQPDEPHWTITVADNGIGIDPSRAAEVFEPFRRVHDGEFPGTGLGLARCRRIVELHGGHIWAEPNDPHGTRLRFLLPARKDS
jgi:PAS domain S-box-containing protein